MSNTHFLFPVIPERHRRDGLSSGFMIILTPFGKPIRSHAEASVITSAAWVCSASKTAEKKNPSLIQPRQLLLQSGWSESDKSWSVHNLLSTSGRQSDTSPHPAPSAKSRSPKKSSPELLTSVQTDGTKKLPLTPHKNYAAPLPDQAALRSNT